MRIAFDLHGVIDKYPLKFMEMIQGFEDNGTMVYIISGPPKNEIIKDISFIEKKFGYDYDGIFKYLIDDIISVVDWIKSIGVEMKQHPDKSWYCSDAIWWTSKARICRLLEIDMLFDDHLEYKKHMDQTKTIFCHVT